MKQPASFRPGLTPNLIASAKSLSMVHSPPGSQPGRAHFLQTPLLWSDLARQPETLPMRRFACLLALLALTCCSAEAQTKKGAKWADSYRRAECYRELGYTRAQARKPTKAAIEEVDQCLARRRVNPAGARQARTRRPRRLAEGRTKRRHCVLGIGAETC